LRGVASDVASLVVGRISGLSLASFVVCLRVSWVVDRFVVGEAFDCECDRDCVVSVAYFARMARNLSMPDILVIGDWEIVN
jgi:hypothetical protein